MLLETAVLVCAVFPDVDLLPWLQMPRAVEKPVICEYRQEAGRAIHFGSKHTNDPGHPQYAQLFRLWDELRPTVAFSEGGIRQASPTADEAIQRYGEPGVVRFLADRDNVPLRSLEPPDDLQMTALRKQFPADRLKLFFMLRAANGVKRDGIGAMESVAASELRRLATLPGMAGPPATVQEAAELFAADFPAVGDWRDAPAEWLSPVLWRTYLNDITRAVDDLRDRYMFALVADAVRRGERAMVVVGSGHVIREQPGLAAAFQDALP